MGRRLVLIACMLLALSAGRATAAPGLIYGINDDNYRHDWKNMWAQTASLHVQQVGVWLTTDCKGSLPSLGQIPAWQPVLVVLMGPGSHASPCLWPDGAAAYAMVARQLALRYHNIREIQVWNEEDLCWWPCYNDGTKPRFRGWFFNKYLDLLAATHDALAGTGVKVLGFGLSPQRDWAWTQEKIASGVVDWYKLRNWSRPIMDGFAYHPYCGYQDSATQRIVTAFNQAWAQRSMIRYVQSWHRVRVTRRFRNHRGNHRGWVRRRYWTRREDVHAVRTVMPFPQPSFNRGLRIWWTETGFDAGYPPGQHGYFGVEGGIASCAHGTPEQEATRDVLLYELARNNPVVAAVFNFLLYDEANLATWQSGLFYPDGLPKPAYFALQTEIGT